MLHCKLKESSIPQPIASCSLEGEYFYTFLRCIPFSEAFVISPCLHSCHHLIFQIILLALCFVIIPQFLLLDYLRPLLLPMV